MIDAVQQRFSSAYGWFVLGVVSVMSSSVWAQAADAVEQLRPPKTTESPSSPKYLMMGVLVLLLAGVVVAVTLKAKRGHQD